VTRHGSLDILCDPDGAPPYRELKRRGLSIDVRGRRVTVASIDDLIAMKDASGRPKDKLMATELRGVSDTRRAPRD
jgi:hypothetical protein